MKNTLIYTSLLVLAFSCSADAYDTKSEQSDSDEENQSSEQHETKEKTSTGAWGSTYK